MLCSECLTLSGSSAEANIGFAYSLVDGNVMGKLHVRLG